MRAAVALAVLLAASSARGDDKDMPWAAGVSADAQREANALFAAGNSLFAEQAHSAALEKYQAALAIWDHPLVRFNMAVTLIRLDRLVEADDQLARALRYGDKPFTPELYRQALDYQTLVAGRVGTITARCKQPHVQISLDGKPWFECPGERAARALAGRHAVVGERTGLMTESRRVLVLGGSVAAETIALVPVENAVTLRYPLKRWTPWVTAGAGVAIAATGLGVWFWGRHQMDQFDTEFAMQCPTGCELDLSKHPSLASLHSSARLKGGLGTGLMIGGGAITIGGVVLALLNRPHRELPVDVQPRPGGASVVVTGRF